jgi:hypothetical protein
VCFADFFSSSRCGAAVAARKRICGTLLRSKYLLVFSSLFSGATRASFIGTRVRKSDSRLDNRKKISYDCRHQWARDMDGKKLIPKPKSFLCMLPIGRFTRKAFRNLIGRGECSEAGESRKVWKAINGWKESADRALGRCGCALI